MAESTLLFLAAFAASAISGAAGFGGALLLLPVLLSVIGATQAVPLLTVVQLIGNLSRIGFGFRQISWKPVGLFLLGAVPLSICGAISFVHLPKESIIRLIGAAILLFVLLTQFGLFKMKSGPALLICGGGVVGFVSGMVGSAGPLGAAIFLSLGLPPVAYIASEATTALAMHGVKTIVYGQYIPFSKDFWFLAAILSLAVILGTWLSNRIIDRLPQKLFQRFVAVLLIAISLYMIIFG